MLIFGISASIVVTAFVAAYMGNRNYKSRAKTAAGRFADCLVNTIACALAGILLAPEVANMLNLMDADLTITAILSLTAAELVTTIKSIAASKDRIMDYIFKR